MVARIQPIFDFVNAMQASMYGRVTGRYSRLHYDRLEWDLKCCGSRHFPLL